LLIGGDADPANPASIPEAELAGWKQREHVTFLGHIAEHREIVARWAARHAGPD